MNLKLALSTAIVSLGAFWLATAAGAQDALVHDGPRASLSLDGSWQAMPIAGLDFAYPPPKVGWKNDAVPEAVSPVINSIGGPYAPPQRELTNADCTVFKQSDRMAAWYRRDFEVRASDLAGKRAVLHFAGMAFRSDTWLNGTHLGRSVLGQLPIDYDVSAAIVPGLNHIVVGLAGREAIFDLAAKSYLAPASGVQAGIWGDVELRLLPAVRVRDIFVKTFVGTAHIEIEATLVNSGNTACVLRPTVAIGDLQGRDQTEIQGTDVSLAPGQESVVTLRQNWLAPHLWTPRTPFLYNARIELRDGRTLLDSATQRFGFREFEIRGRDFYLNGVRTVLLRNSFLMDLSTSPERAGSEVLDNVGQPYNAARLHLGFDSPAAIDAADEMGLMLTPEFAWWHTDGAFPVEQSAVWLANVLAYARGLVRLERNHPSIVIWNLTNETFWGTTDAARMKIADSVLATVRAADPTRPQEGDGEVDWGGRLPIVNIHYPESAAGSLLARYPNSGILEPNDLDWLAEQGNNQSWRANFTWDRPLVIGEYWDSSGDPDLRSSFMGESVYDFEKWRQQDFAGRDAQGANEYVECLKRATDLYRLRGVAGINPWSGDRNQIMPQIAVRPLDFHPNFFAGSTGTRRVVVFNDSGLDYDSLSLQCRLAVDGATVWQKTIDAPTASGAHTIVDVPIEFPQMQSQTRAALSIRLRYWHSGGWAQLSRHEEQVYILPVERAAAGDGNGLVLLDSSGATAAALHRMGLDLTPKATLTADDLANAGTLIVGSDTDARPFAGQIESFVQHGGRAVLLNQDGGAPLCGDLAPADDKHAATRVWMRAYQHPILDGLDDAQFSFWQPDNLVSQKSLQKPSTGSCKIILDAGGLFGLRWAPLVETRHGEGIFLQSQLNLVDRIGAEPLAGHLLLAMLHYCRDYHPASGAPLRVLVGGNDALKEVLKATSVVSTVGLAGDGPVLLDSSYSPSSAEITQLTTFLAGGGKVWLHGFSAANIGPVASLFPFAPQLTPYDPTIQGAARRSSDALMSNLSSYDFQWTRIDLGARGDYFGAGQPTAKLGGAVLLLPSHDAGQNLIEPGLLVKVNAGAGTILFDNLLWENALGAETDKVARLVSALALNLGGQVRIAPEAAYDYFQADLAAFANMGYYDEVAGDGKGGWTDQGINDMRYFLINHSGKAGEMEVGVGAFPTQVTMADRPFHLVDPKANNGHAVITLRGQEHGPGMPTQVTGISIGKRADKLWFLQTACWAVDNTVHQEIGRYIIHYGDGTQAIFPLRYGIELSDWWDPRPLPDSRVAWTGKNDMHAPIGIYATEWTNPSPEKVIAGIDLVGSESATQIVLLAITGGVVSHADAKSDRTIADWNLGAARDSLVPNEVGSGALRFGATAPTAVGQGESAALHFAHGSSLMAQTGDIPGFVGGGPLALQVTLVPDAAPDGYEGGIYQACDYLKSGFRLLLNRGWQATVEIFPADGKARYLTGKTPLLPGRLYRLEVRFEAQHAYLTVDDKLDGVVDTPPPAPYQGQISIGRAGGNYYYFNGSIGRIILSVPAG